MTFRPEDTSPEANEAQWKLIREMTPAQRAIRMAELTAMVQTLAFAGMKRRHPSDSDDEIWLRLAVQRLGPDVVKRIYGFEAVD